MPDLAGVGITGTAGDGIIGVGITGVIMILFGALLTMAASTIDGLFTTHIDLGLMDTMVIHITETTDIMETIVIMALEQLITLVDVVAQLGVQMV